MIIISDGDPSAPSQQHDQRALKTLNVTISTVAVGAHGPAESGLLSDLAATAGGKFYKVNDPRSLPRIFQREARRVARPLIWDKHPVQPQVKMPSHEMLSGVDWPLPPIKGFVLTTKKEGSPLVETLLTSPEPAGEENNTVLAGWTYGLGKAVAFTSDAGARWTTDWTAEPMYDKFFGQMVRWSMRPAGGSGKFTVATDIADGQVRVVVNALDKNDEFLNFLSMNATAVGPDMKPVPMRIEQTSPGRYVGAFPARDAGSYFVMLSPGTGQAPIRAGITVPYSDEFREREPNDALLEQLAAVVPKDGPAGKVIEVPDDFKKADPLPAVDPFRHDLPKATSNQDAWHYFLLAACCMLFADVFCRRVHVHFDWVPPLAGRARDWVLRRQPKLAAPEFMQRLQSRKAEVSDHIDQLRAATRFEPSPERPVDAEVLEDAAKPSGECEESKPRRPVAGRQPKPEAESYTERLLKAKKKVWDDREKK